MKKAGSPRNSAAAQETTESMRFTARSTQKEEEKVDETITIDSVDEGIELAGNFGRFQAFAAFVLIVGYMTGEIVVQNMAYLELMPHYEC